MKLSWIKRSKFIHTLILDNSFELLILTYLVHQKKYKSECFGTARFFNAIKLIDAKDTCCVHIESVFKQILERLPDE